MLRALYKKIVSGPDKIEEATALLPEKCTPPFTIRVSIPIKTEDDSAFEGMREEFVMESTTKKVSYGQILDFLCHLDDDDLNRDMWRIENALDTVISVDYGDRGRFTKEIGDSGLRCPVNLILADRRKVPSYIELMVEQ